MKKLFTILVFLFCAAGVANAQTKGFTGAGWGQMGISMNPKQDFTSIDVALAGGYAFNSTVALRAQFEVIIGMWSAPGLKWSDNPHGNFRMNATLGPSVVVNLLKDDKGWGIVDAAATVGHSLYVKDWSYIYYDLGFGWTTPVKDPSESTMRFMAGVGIRYNDAHRPDTRDYLNFYVKVGFRFN